MNEETPDPPILRAAEALADGAPIDWERPDLGTEAQGLRLIERITRAYATPVDGATRPRGPLPVPERIGRFPIEGVLGIGGMGVVYRGRDPRLDRPVAIKTLAPERFQNAAARARLEREARLLASVNHPNIGTIYGLEEDEAGGAFLVLELVPGASLGQRLSQGALTVADALSVTSAIAEALAAAHETGVLHGDLKPANVMIDRAGRVRVLDFGLAHRLADAAPVDAAPGTAPARASRPATRSTSVVGTPGYIAPERLTGRSDERSDLFSLGCILYEVLTGAAAFSGATTDEVLEAVLRTSPDLDRLPEDTPADAREIVASCLERDPDRRPAGARAVLEALGRVRGRPTEPGAIRSLPEPGSPFVGRSSERAECARLLQSARLVTLTGVGGSGKTRLAIEAARSTRGRFPGGVWFADLIRAAQDEEVPGLIAAAVGDVSAKPDETLASALERRLESVAGLLVLDNAEHVLERVAEVAFGILRRCPGVTVLVTSRQALSVEGERVFRVPALPVPSAEEPADPATLGAVASVALFVDRARHSSPDFALDASNAPAVATIVRRLEGLPLAIELAAARCRVLSPAEIASRLDRPLALLRGHRASSQRRHATMRAALAWSADLLHEDEAAAFRRLAVCAGGFDLEAACPIVDVADPLDMVDTLSRLADKSLIEVIPCPGRPTRYRMLEPVRELARERLESAGEAEACRERHAAHFLSFVETAEEGMLGKRASVWFDRVEDEYGNITAAFERFLDSADGVESALRMAGSLWRFGRMRDYRSSCFHLADRALARSSPADPPPSRARAFFARGALWPSGLDMNPGSRADFEEAARLFALAGDHQREARALNGMGMSWSSDLKPERARPCFERAALLYREVGDVRGLSTVLHNLARDAWLGRDLPRALALMEDCLTSCDVLPEDQAVEWIAMALLQVRLGRLAEARGSLRSALPALYPVGVRHEHGMALLLALAELAEREARDEEAARLLGAADQLVFTLGWILSEEDFQWHERDATLNRLRERLGADRFRELYESGRTLAPEDAVKEGEAGLR